MADPVIRNGVVIPIPEADAELIITAKPKSIRKQTDVIAGNRVVLAGVNAHTVERIAGNDIAQGVGVAADGVVVTGDVDSHFVVPGPVCTGFIQANVIALNEIVVAGDTNTIVGEIDDGKAFDDATIATYAQ